MYRGKEEKDRVAWFTELVRNPKRKTGLERVSIHTEKSFRNITKPNRNQIVFTILRLIWNQTNVRSVSNQSENGKNNLI